MSHHISDEMRACIDKCLECYATCVETKSHCTHMGGKHADPMHLGALADCAMLCETSANFMLRSSLMQPQVCGVCADACDRCADSCERLGGNGETMRRCAKVCRECAKSCREMAQMAGAH